MVRAREALDRYGNAKAIVLARVILVVRTVLNPLAGTVGVPARTFTVWQVAGRLIWSVGVTLASYVLGSRIPNIDHYLLPIVVVMVVLTLVPVALELRRSRGPRPPTGRPAQPSTRRSRCPSSCPPPPSAWSALAC